MKKFGIYAFTGVGIMLLYLVWISFFPAFFNAMTWEAAATVGTGCFLSLEIALFAGAILTKLDRK